MALRWAVVICEDGVERNYFKGDRTYKNKRYAEAKLDTLHKIERLTNRRMNVYLKRVDVPHVCPQCGK